MGVGTCACKGVRRACKGVRRACKACPAMSGESKEEGAEEVNPLRHGHSPAGTQLPRADMVVVVGECKDAQAAGGQGDGRAQLPRADMVVCGGVPEKRQKWRQVGRREVRAMAKLDESKVAWIVREKAKGELTNSQIAESMNVSVRWVQRIWARYKHLRPSEVQFPMPMGRPSAGLPGRREHGAVAGMRALRKGGAARMEGYIERNAGIHIPHRTIHAVLEADGEVEKVGKYFKRKEWVRWECSHSNMMWHTDFMQLPGGRWLIAYEDDASRRIMAHGAFTEATAANAIAVLHEGVDRHGRPASLMTDHGSQFFANEAEGRRRGEAAFESELERLNIRHVLARVAHPQTNGKIERFHRVVRRHLGEFEAEGSRTSTRSDLPGGQFTVGGPFHNAGVPQDAMSRLVEWYNYDRDHMSLDEGETPAMAYARKMPPKGVTVTDEQSGISYRRE